MAYFFIRTQILENYGAHAKDGRFSSGNAFWKFKGSDEYVISGVDREQDAVAFVAAIAVNNLSYKEFPISWVQVSSDFMTDRELDQWDVAGSYIPAKRINVQQYFKARQEAA